MPDFVSYAQNGEDVVLWRALGKVSAGRYVEVGACHPSHDSVTRAFYDRGWSGITVEPVRATSLDNVLDDSGWAGEEIHFMLIDVEGAEHDVLASVDLKRWRPWVLVVESTEPNSTETTHDGWEPDVLACGYEFCLFDGLSRFYVATERSDRLRAALSYPACVLDSYQTLSDTIAAQERQELLEQTVHWRTIALTRWADAVSHDLGLGSDPTEDDEDAENPGNPENAQLVAARTKLLAIERTISWRVTRPLRRMRRTIDRARGR